MAKLHTTSACLTLALLLLPALSPAAMGEGDLLQDNDAGTGGDVGNDAASAHPVVPGAYVGRVREGVDPADWYAFHADAGKGVVVTLDKPPGTPWPLDAPADLSVYDAQGATLLQNGHEVDFVAAVSGTYLVRVTTPCVTPLVTCTWNHATSQSSANRTYLLDLVVEELVVQDDVGSGGDAGDGIASATPLPDGFGVGWVDRFDHFDYYAIAVTRGESIDVQVWSDPNMWLGEGLIDANGTFLGRSGGYQLNQDPWYGATSWTSDRNGTVYLRVSDSHFPGHYRVWLTRASAADYLRPTPLQGGPIDGFPSAVGDGTLRVASGASLWRLNATNATREAAASNAWGTAHDASGRVYFTDFADRRVKRLEANGTATVLANGAGEIAFGPDGALYLLDGGYASYVDRIEEGGAKTRAGGFIASLENLAFAPDGTAYAVRNRTTLVRIDLANGTLHDVWESGCWCHGLAFDAQGRAYTTNALSQSLYRVDLGTGSLTLLGLGDDYARVGFAGSDLYATGEDRGTYRATRFALDAPGFEGFRPAWG